MKFSQIWLESFLDKKIQIEELSEKLTSSGLEVDSIEKKSLNSNNFILGEIEQIKEHPYNCQLYICQVNVGMNKNLSLICRQYTLQKGMKVLVAEVIGMCFPALLKNDSTYVPLGSLINISNCKFLTTHNNFLEVDLTPNRGDCLSTYGLAREMAVLTGVNITELKRIKLNTSKKCHKRVVSKDKSACQRYFGRLIYNINPKVETPPWIKERLNFLGIKSSSVINDIITYILFELGQPMNAFDADKISNNISIRFAKMNENITISNGKKLNLKPDTLVVADDSNVLSIAGVLAGEEYLVTDNTRNVFLESAYFLPEIIAGKSRQYGLESDASHRFERGVDPKLCKLVIDYATALIIEIAGGESSNIICVDHYQFTNIEISLHLSKIHSILGTTIISPEFVEKTLNSLNFKFKRICEGNNASQWNVIAPSYRFDIKIEEDLIEEIGRIYGYENLPITLPKMTLMQPKISDKIISINSLKNILVNRGYHEVINYSFIDQKLDALFFDTPGIKLKNPVSNDMSVMRQGLIPGLIKTFKDNLYRQQSRIRIFEEGTCFKPSENLANEHSYFSGLIYGTVTPGNWQERIQSDFYSVKSDIEALLKFNKISPMYIACKEINWLHPGKSSYIYKEDQLIGVIGVLHPNVTDILQISRNIPIIFELQINKLNHNVIPQFVSISKYPSVSRDVSLIVDCHITASDLIDTVKQTNDKLLKNIELLDVYQGNHLPDGKKSITLNLIFQDDFQTLTDQTINGKMKRILVFLEKNINAVIRK